MVGRLQSRGKHWKISAQTLTKIYGVGLKKMNKIYYDGDSFSYLGVEKNTGHYLADFYNLELDHYGYGGKSPAQCIRSAMRYVFNDFSKNTFMCIGIGVGSRLDVHLEDKEFDRNYPFKVWLEESGTGSLSVDALLERKVDKKTILELTTPDFVRTNVLLNLILLHDFLLQNKVKFIIHNLDINYVIDKDYIFQSRLLEQIESRPRLVNFLKNSLHDLMYEKNIQGWDYEQYGFMAHPAEDGHSMYADFLAPYVEKYMK